ncbi:MAG: hypothetical protein R3B47_15930 [Bacteroidia bacterium]
MNRSLIITQTGCRRHHVTIILTIAPEALPANTPQEAFYIQEALTIMHMVYWEHDAYCLFKKDFEENFIAGLKKREPAPNLISRLGHQPLFAACGWTRPRGPDHH